MTGAELKVGLFVVYQERRYKVHSIGTLDALEHSVRLRPKSGPDVMTRACELLPWKRGSKRTIRGKTPHRQGRPVVFQYDGQTGVVTLRLKRTRKGYTTTLEGLFDLIARQDVINKKRERAWRKRTGKKA